MSESGYQALDFRTNMHAAMELFNQAKINVNGQVSWGGTRHSQSKFDARPRVVVSYLMSVLLPEPSGL